MLEELTLALRENPALLVRVLKEGLKVGLADSAFREALSKGLAEICSVELIDPLYSKKLAARLVPCTLHQFNKLVRENRMGLKTPYYTLIGEEHRRHRLFYASDIKKIRAYLYAPFRESTKLKFKEENRQAAIGERGNSRKRQQGAADRYTRQGAPSVHALQ